jgi:hypothetical protein
MESAKKSMSPTQFVESIAYLLHETFEGSPEGQPSAYLDRGTGLINTLDDLSADEASREVTGMTIAAQTEHAKFYLDRLCEFMNGRVERVNWDDSWLIETVDEQEWDALRSGLKTTYQNSLRCLADLTEWDEQKAGMAVGLIAHTAYHLGSIRQLAKSLKSV